jgi:hypothetical protein
MAELAGCAAGGATDAPDRPLLVAAVAQSPMSDEDLFTRLTAERRQVSFEKKELHRALLRLIQDSLARDVYDAHRRQLIGGILEPLDSCNDDLCKLNPEIQRLIKERLAAAVRSAA